MQRGEPLLVRRVRLPAVRHGRAEHSFEGRDVPARHCTRQCRRPACVAHAHAAQPAVLHAATHAHATITTPPSVALTAWVC
jgi:hypothetical protein